MSGRGFVYMLANSCMPCYYKIGMTGKPPHRRAAELSASTSVPEKFRVICYVEVDRPNEVERRLHDFLADFRANFEREFFMFRDEHLPWAIGLFQYHPARISFEQRKTMFFPENVVAINPWHANDLEPEMTDVGPIAFIDVEPV
jgi:hypothetical protein